MNWNDILEDLKLLMVANRIIMHNSITYPYPTPHAPFRQAEKRIAAKCRTQNLTISHLNFNLIEKLAQSAMMTSSSKSKPRLTTVEVSI